MKTFWELRDEIKGINENLSQKESAGIPHKYTVDLYHKNHGSHDSFIKKAKSAGIKGAYSGVNKDGKVKVSLNHHDNSDGGTLHKFLKKHYDKNMSHGNMQTMKTGSSSQKESLDIQKVNEISNKTIDSYRDKAQKSLKKSGKYFDTGSGITNNPKTAAKHKKTIDKRTKGLGSVIKRAGVSSGPQKYITKPSYSDNVKKGTPGYTLVNKPDNKLAKSYKDR